MKQIVCEINKCLACRTCEIACTVEHSQSKNLLQAIKEFPTPVNRIHVLGINSNPLNRIRAIALQCRHCAEPVCVQACISGGIKKDEISGNVTIYPEKCVGCWSCIMVCPFGAITKNEQQHRAIKCDHCPDRETPACVNACPTGALLFIEQEEIELIYLDE